MNILRRLSGAVDPEEKRREQFAPLEAKMRAEGLSEACIRAFEHGYAHEVRGRRALPSKRHSSLEKKSSPAPRRERAVVLLCT